MQTQPLPFLFLPPPFQSIGLRNAFIYASMMLLAPLLGTLGAGMANRMSIGTQIMIRSELIAMIYRKALNLSTRWEVGVGAPACV
jgi:hypothetical protein